MNTPVNFELAKLLKEKGLKYYSTNNYFYNEHGEIKYGKALNTYNDYPAELDECDAPTIAEVVMWLYKKHGIWIYCDETFRPYIIKDGENKIYHGELSRLKKINDVYKAVYIWDSPTEAYEAAIEYTLTNLI